MISQTEPHGGEVFIDSPPLSGVTFASPMLIPFWRVLRRPIGKEKKSTQAWLRSSGLSGTTPLGNLEVGFSSRYPHSVEKIRLFTKNTKQSLDFTCNTIRGEPMLTQRHLNNPLVYQDTFQETPMSCKRYSKIILMILQDSTKINTLNNTGNSG